MRPPNGTPSTSRALETIARRLSALGGLGCLAILIFVTLSPIDERPVVAGQDLEHVAAYALTAMLLRLGFPARAGRIAFGLVAAAAGLELAQLLTFDRHGTVLDFVRKSVGIGLGLGLGVAGDAAFRRLKGAAAPSRSTRRDVRPAQAAS